VTAGRVEAAGAHPMLDIRDLAFAYPDGHQALFGIDLSVAEGERVAVLGPNGAGKTTLVLHLNGILTPGRGSVRVGGLRVESPHLLEIRRRVGIVFQDPDDQLFMPSVREDVAFGPYNLGLRGDELDRHVRRALEQVDMLHAIDRVPHHLSLGQRRRVAVATVLAMSPQVLVLDEPSSNLDPTSRRELAAIVLGLGLTTVVVTHDLPMPWSCARGPSSWTEACSRPTGRRPRCSPTTPCSLPTASSSRPASGPCRPGTRRRPYPTSAAPEPEEPTCTHRQRATRRSPHSAGWASG